MSVFAGVERDALPALLLGRVLGHTLHPGENVRVWHLQKHGEKRGRSRRREHPGQFQAVFAFPNVVAVVSLDDRILIRARVEIDPMWPKIVDRLERLRWRAPAIAVKFFDFLSHASPPGTSRAE